jgi:hypothetical protein
VGSNGSYWTSQDDIRAFMAANEARLKIKHQNSVADADISDHTQVRKAMECNGSETILVRFRRILSAVLIARM